MASDDAWNPNEETEDDYHARMHAEAWDDDFDDDFDDDWDDDGEPTGSCDNCGSNIYDDEDYGGLCSQCAWLAQQG